MSTTPTHHDPPSSDRADAQSRPDDAAPSGPDPDPDPASASASGSAEARWVRPLLAAAGVVVLLLLGATGGLLIGLPASSGTTIPDAASIDVGFAQDMSAHHQQAVQMSSWERDHTADPVLEQLAADIETTQNAQVGRMQGWLELWGAAPLPLGGHMAWMSAPAHGHAAATPVATMPGMASAEELSALRAATGPALDVLYLQLVLRHHEGGASMLRYGAEHAAVPQVRNLATQMLSSQSAEIDYLRQLLAQRGGQPLPV